MTRPIVERHRRDFGMLWTGQTLSVFGDQFLVVALPLLALDVVGATAAQAALLPFALFVPFLLIGLPAGALVDRLPRRGTMIVCDAVQATVFGTVAALAIAGGLEFWVLMVLVGLGGTAVVFFQVAYTSYLPELFSEPAELQKGNSRLFLSESVSRTLGPMAAGPVIGALGAAVAIVVNACTFVVSLVSLVGIRHRSAPPTPKPRDRGWLGRDIREGLRFVFSHRKLEPVISCGVVYVLFLTVVEATLVLFCKNVLGLSATGIGLVVGAAAAGFPIGNMLAPWLLARLGMARTLVASATVSVVGLALTPVAGSAGSVIGLVVASIVHGAGEGVFGPTALTLRQTETPDDLLGRVNSVQRFLMWGAAPIGSLLTAGLISVWGLSTALWVGGLGTAMCLVPLLRRGVLDDLTAPRDRGISTTTTQAKSA